METNFYKRLAELVQGWGYTENEAREMLEEDEKKYGYPMHDFEVTC